MDTYTLSEQLRALSPAACEWTFFLYSAKKSKDGPELTCGRCDMADMAGWVEVLKATLLQKTLAERTVAEYSPLNPKEIVGAVEKSNPLLGDPLTNFLVSIRHADTYAPEDFVTGVMPKPNGYGFYGRTRGEDGNITGETLLLKRSNPFVTGAKTRLCLGGADGVRDSDRPVLKFTAATDFVYIGETGYFISASAEKDFGLESRQFAICERRMRAIADAGIVSDYDAFEKAAFKAKNARKFLDFDRDILEHIRQLSFMDRGDFLIDYGISTDAAGLMDTADPDQCEMIIDLLCCRSCKDPLGRLAVGSITPRV